jgi:hypothetical protein
LAISHAVRQAPGRIAGAEASPEEKDMQFFVYGSPTEKQQPRDPAELGKFMEESVKKGILITGGGLHRKETRILLTGGKV